jgi:RHS repeat-associated protein
VFVNGRTIADVVGVSGSGTINYDFLDHLGSTNVTADSNNRVQEVSDYTSYGALNNHDQLAGFSEQRKYIGQMYDTDTNLSYLQARYFSSTQGQFISQDPVFWEIGLTQDGKSVLSNPQMLDSYGYANDNPISGKDPSGRLVSEYQPYLPSGADYATKDLIGSYRGSDITSRGPGVLAYDSRYQCTTFADAFIGQQFNGASLKGVGMPSTMAINQP